MFTHKLEQILNSRRGKNSSFFIRSHCKQPFPLPYRCTLGDIELRFLSAF
jgi:hypothetical protein